MRKKSSSAGYDNYAATCTASVSYTPQLRQPEQLTHATAQVIITFVPKICFSIRKMNYRMLVQSKWRSGEYRIPEDCTGYMLGTTAILSPRKSTDRKTQQIHQHNYDSFIRIMADMIRKYGSKVQSSQEDL